MGWKPNKPIWRAFSIPQDHSQFSLGRPLAANGGNKTLDSLSPKAVEAALLAQHGELMSGEGLRRAMGYRSERTYLRAIKAGTVPVSVFSLPGRRGRFARTRDVAAWLADVGRSG